MRRLLGLALAALLSWGCAGPILANPSAPLVTPQPTPEPSTRPSDPIPVELPRDDAPHDRLTEWWYYTGHLQSGDRTFGFEFVIFRAERGAFPVTWASHFAITDETAGTFRYDQRSEIGAQVDRSPGGPGFDLAISGADAASARPVPAAALTPWTMRGADGSDRLAAISRADGGFGIDLELNSWKPAALHDGDGWIDFGPAGGSYYYSRTAMMAAGELTIAGEAVPVTGIAWFDHQWGDFISVGGSGWDWFAINLENDEEVTLSLVRDADDGYPLVYGTLVGADGRAQHLDRDDFSVEVTATWTSEATGATYPAGWTIEIPRDGLVVHLRPTVADQELDTRATTGVVYWEGSQVVEATKSGSSVAGQAYVELTGYGAVDGSSPPSY